MAKQATKPAATKVAAPQKTTPAEQEFIEKEFAEENFTVKKQTPVKPTWEIKDRLYTLKHDKKPLLYVLPSKHTSRKPLLWFDEEKGYNRELRYSTNQRSPIADEQSGMVTLGRIMIRNGAIAVPKEDQALQLLLSKYHPGKDTIYEEYNPVQDSLDETQQIELEIDALLIAKQMDINEAEAVLRVEHGNSVDNLSTSELKRDLLIFAKRQPGLFIELANDDNVELRNIGIKATQYGIIQLSPDQRTFTYGENKRKLMTVPFDEHPYSALAAWFKTDEGMEVLKHITKKL